jgi:hypothetical protein
LTEHQPLIFGDLPYQQLLSGQPGFVPLQFLDDVCWNRDGPLGQQQPPARTPFLDIKGAG